MPDRGAGQGRGPPLRCLPGADRGADSVRDGARRAADARSAGRLSTLVLPNIAALSTSQCDQIRAFVARGGSVVATHETSMYDEWGKRRADFGVGDLFGARVAGDVEDDDQELLPSPARRPPHRPATPVARRSRGRDPVDQRRPACGCAGGGRVGTQAVDARAHPPRPADGGGLPAGDGRRRARGLSPRDRRRAGRLLPVGHRPHVLGGAESRPRPSAAKRRRLGYPCRTAPVTVTGAASWTSPSGGNPRR